MNLTEKMMIACRGVRWLKEDDTSEDDKIKSMKPADIVRDCAQWELGDKYWADVVASWMVAAGCDPKDMQ